MVEEVECNVAENDRTLAVHPAPAPCRYAVRAPEAQAKDGFESKLAVAAATFAEGGQEKEAALWAQLEKK